MKDQLTRDFESMIRTVRGLEKRVRELEGQNRFTAATDWMPANWWGRISPTQPASKIVQVHGGFLWLWDPGSGQGYFRKMDDTIYDFSSVAPFAATGHFKWVVLQADLSAAAPTFTTVESPEFGTSEECEQDFWDNGPVEDLYHAYLPLCCVVVQNDGALATSGAILNITLADRVQSYLLARDIRPWLHLHYSGGIG